jgi:hypothetical protein
MVDSNDVCGFISADMNSISNALATTLGSIYVLYRLYEQRRK